WADLLLPGLSAHQQRLLAECDGAAARAESKRHARCPPVCTGAAGGAQGAAAAARAGGWRPHAAGHSDLGGRLPGGDHRADLAARRDGVAGCSEEREDAKATARLAPGLHLTEMQDYLSWTLPLSAASRNADGPTLHRLARDMVKQWRPALRR